MSGGERRERGMQVFDEVYGGIVPFPPKQLHDDFLFNNVDQLFAEIWSRKRMSFRDRRLFLGYPRATRMSFVTRKVLVALESPQPQ